MDNQLLLAFYGDDFTGSTDVLEALSRAGLKAALFLQPPSQEQLHGRDLHAIGVAGISRSLPAAAMEAELRPIFEVFRELQPRLVHYKICSTFDSSPQIGSIGRAIEIAQSTLRSPWVPLVVGAPILGRYCVFGNLFARSGGESDVFRLDRHPTMSAHPTTPMNESDLRRHLARQTAKTIALFDALKLAQPIEQAQSTLKTIFEAGAEVVLFDTLTDEHLATIGALLWQSAREAPLFCAGSSGVEYALTAHWRNTGTLPAAPAFASNEVEQLVAVSGSCSPVTAGQIEWAVAHSWEQVSLQTDRLMDAAHCQEEIEQAMGEAVKVLSSGHSVVLHTCCGPHDERLKTAQLAGANANSAEALGEALGRILRAVLQKTNLTRVAVTGGDTSGFVARALEIESLEFVSTLYPGSPLCRARSSREEVDGLEIVFKGGQVGKADFFECVRRGHI